MLEPAEKCTFCDAPLVVASDETSEPVPVGVSARSESPANPAISVEPEWRTEVSRRLEAYRVRRGRPRPDDSQS
ncbi:MAG: hypothetical protein WCC18_00800, partial [Candidatus Acidiferrales bacterium]